MGDTSHTLGTVLRLVTAALIALAALPVALTLVRTRRPELATPEVALRLRLWSAVAHAGQCLDRRSGDRRDLAEPRQGRPVALRRVRRRGGGGDPRHRAFYLSFVAEQPPAPPETAQGEAPGSAVGRRPTRPPPGRQQTATRPPPRRRRPRPRPRVGPKRALTRPRPTSLLRPPRRAHRKPAEKPRRPPAEDGALRNKRRPAGLAPAPSPQPGAASPPTNRSGVTDGSSLC